MLKLSMEGTGWETTFMEGTGWERMAYMAFGVHLKSQPWLGKDRGIPELSRRANLA